MKAGLHLLSEKPLAETVSAADRMIRTAKRTGVAFAVMFQWRTEPVKLPISRREYDAFLAKMRKASTFKKRTRRMCRETDPQHQ